MSDFDAALFARVVLERLLGQLPSEYTDGADGARMRRTLSWTCGCLATEADPPWFRLICCREHKGTTAA